MSANAWANTRAWATVTGFFLILGTAGTLIGGL